METRDLRLFDLRYDWVVFAGVYGHDRRAGWGKEVEALAVDAAHILRFDTAKIPLL